MSSPSVTTCDVAVLGFGGAGASAAIVAHDAGASTTIVEASSTPGGNTRASGGSLRPVADIAGALSYLDHLCGGETPREVLSVLVTETGPTLEWLGELGATLVPLHGGDISVYPKITDVTYPDVPGASAMVGRLRVKGGSGELGGPALWGVLESAVRERGITTLLGARARRLERAADGAGFEVRTTSVEGDHLVRARSVVLATGGFGHASALVQDFVGHPLSAFGPADNRGDGLLMAQAVGADLWHTPAFAATLGYVVEPLPVPVRHQSPSAGFIYVDSNGHRFVDETGTDFHALPMAFLSSDTRTGRYTRMPSHFIFDEQTRRSGPIANTSLTFGNMMWSDDNSAEVAAGIIASAPSIAELARVVGVDSDALVRTVEDYNRAPTAGAEDEFGRQEIEPIAEPPFYAIPVSPVLVNTQGGPRRDHCARVLRPDGSPIEALFGAGELGSIWGQHYPGAGNLTEALVFGRLAGRGAAAEAMGAAR